MRTFPLWRWRFKFTTQATRTRNEFIWICISNGSFLRGLNFIFIWVYNANGTFVILENTYFNWMCIKRTCWQMVSFCLARCQNVYIGRTDLSFSIISPFWLDQICVFDYTLNSWIPKFDQQPPGLGANVGTCIFIIGIETDFRLVLLFWSTRLFTFDKQPQNASCHYFRALIRRNTDHWSWDQCAPGLQQTWLLHWRCVLRDGFVDLKHFWSVCVISCDVYSLFVFTASAEKLIVRTCLQLSLVYSSDMQIRLHVQPPVFLNYSESSCDWQTEWCTFNESVCICCHFQHAWMSVRHGTKNLLQFFCGKSTVGNTVCFDIFLVCRWNSCARMVSKSRCRYDRVVIALELLDAICEQFSSVGHSFAEISNTLIVLELKIFPLLKL